MTYGGASTKSIGPRRRSHAASAARETPRRRRPKRSRAPCDERDIRGRFEGDSEEIGWRFEGDVEV